MLETGIKITVYLYESFEKLIINYCKIVRSISYHNIVIYKYGIVNNIYSVLLIFIKNKIFLYKEKKLIVKIVRNVRNEVVMLKTKLKM